MAEDLSIKVKVEPDVSDLSNKLKTAGNGVAPIPVKISLANIGDIKNKIATLGTTVDVGVNVKLNNTVDLNSIASNLDGKDIELSSKLKLDASDIQKELNRIGKTLKLNLKVNDDSGLIDKLEKSSNAVRESANKIQQAMNIKLKDGFKVTEKTVTSLSSGLEKIRLNIGKIKDTSAKNRLQKDYDALKSNFNTMLTGREISVLDFSGIQSGLTRLTEQCGDVLSAEKTVSDEATTMKKSLENALSGIKDKFSQTDYKGLGGDEAIKAIKQKFNQQITAANTAIGEYNNDPTATKYEAANKALQALVSTQNELNSTINTTVGESDKLMKRFEAVDNTATSIQTRFAGVDFGRFADVTSVKTASEDYTKKLEAVDAARTALNKNFSSENVDAYDAAVKALGDSLNDLVQKLTKARSALSGFDNIERRYNTAMKKNTTAQNAGYASLMNPESLTNLESAWAAAKKAREAFEADMSTSNLKAYDDAMYELDQSLQAFSSNVNKAKGSSDKALEDGNLVGAQRAGIMQEYTTAQGNTRQSFDLLIQKSKEYTQAIIDEKDISQGARDAEVASLAYLLERHIGTSDTITQILSDYATALTENTGITGEQYQNSIDMLLGVSDQAQLSGDQMQTVLEATTYAVASSTQMDNEQRQTQMDSLIALAQQHGISTEEIIGYLANADIKMEESGVKTKDAHEKISAAVKDACKSLCLDYNTVIQKVDEAIAAYKREQEEISKLVQARKQASVIANGFSVNGGGGSLATQRVARYATGVLNAATTHIAITDEKGPEIKMRKPSFGQYSLIEKGSSVIPAQPSANLWKFGLDPESFIASHMNQRSIKSVEITQPNMSSAPVVNVGDIQMYGVNDPDSFARVLHDRVGGIFAQEFSKR